MALGVTSSWNGRVAFRDAVYHHNNSGCILEYLVGLVRHPGIFAVLGTFMLVTYCLLLGAESVCEQYVVGYFEHSVYRLGDEWRRFETLTVFTHHQTFVFHAIKCVIT